MRNVARLSSICLSVAMLASATAPALASVPPHIRIAAGTVVGSVGVAASTGTTGRAAASATTSTIACGINAALSTTPDGQTLAASGPAPSIYQQSGSSLVLSFPSVSVTATQGSGLAAYRYYAAGAAVLTFADSVSGTITFLPGGTTFSAAPRYAPVFSDFAQTYDATTNQVSVTFTITVGECSVPFAATYQA